MKEGTKVKVLTDISGHGFYTGEIVERRSAEYDGYEGGLGFYSESSGVWYMSPEEYEIIKNEEYLLSLLHEAAVIVNTEDFYNKEILKFIESAIHSIEEGMVENEL